MKKNKPMFISIEGGEGSGKTTLIDAIFLQLKTKGYPTTHTREPGGTTFGEKIRDILLDPSTKDIAPYSELCLFLSSRAQQLYEVILPALKQGNIVLCDRFHDSTIAYQGVARGLGVDKVSNICDLVCDSIKPDLTLYLDIEPKLGLKRATGSKDRIEAEHISFHEKIRMAYLEQAKKEPKRVRVIDTTQDRTTVLKQAMEIIEKSLDLCLR